MYDSDTYDTLKEILTGVNPFTKKKLSSGDLIMHPTIQKALKKAIIMSQAEEWHYRMQWTPINSGSTWCKKEDSVLVSLFKNGLPINVLSVVHQRAEAAIRDRLKYHGFKPDVMPEYLLADYDDNDLDMDDDDGDDDS